VGVGEQVADDLLGFDAAAGFEVAQHGGGEERTGAGEFFADVLDVGLVGLEAFADGDARGLGDELIDEIGGTGGDDVPDGGAHEAGNAGGGGDGDPLLPHVLKDVGPELRGVAGDGEDFVDAMDAGTVGLVAVAELECVERNELEDPAFGVDRGGDAGGAAEDRVAAEALVEHVHVGHAVEQRDNGGLRTNGGGEVVDGAFEVVGLAAQDNEVESLTEAIGGDRGRGREREVAGWTENLEAAVLKLLGATGTDEEGDVAVGGEQPGSEEAANPACSNDENSHESILKEQPQFVLLPDGQCFVPLLRREC